MIQCVKFEYRYYILLVALTRLGAALQSASSEGIQAHAGALLSQAVDCLHCLAKASCHCQLGLGVMPAWPS